MKLRHVAIGFAVAAILASAFALWVWAIGAAAYAWGGVGAFVVGIAPLFVGFGFLVAKVLEEDENRAQ